MLFKLLIVSITSSLMYLTISSYYLRFNTDIGHPS